MIKNKVTEYAASAQQNMSWFNLDGVIPPIVKDSVMPKLRSGFWTISDSATALYKSYFGTSTNPSNGGGDDDNTTEETNDEQNEDTQETTKAT